MNTDAVAQVKAALAPLIEQGIVRDVRLGYWPRYQGDGLTPRETRITIKVVGDLGAHCAEINRLVSKAGIEGVKLVPIGSHISASIAAPTQILTGARQRPF